MKFLFATLLVVMTLASCKAVCEVLVLEEPAKVRAEIAKPGYMLVMYSEDWCGACTDFKPTFKELSNEYKNVRFLIIQKTQLKEHADKVQYIPTLVFGKNEDGLRNRPCWQEESEGRSKVELRAYIKRCMAKE